ncbi:hypothetical protein [Klebsiella michiganensis]|uniref:hypothetical protein n=1 Tax=Klebsiella michiganensis TaxID=1134687 RepID=UPI00300B49E7
MYKDSIQARREIARNFTALNYRIAPLHWQTLCMGVNRDLQAKKLRPNVPVPSRRKVIPFLKMMHQETGSMLKAILAFGFDGPWTSSGGSFRLAREIGFDIVHYAKNIHHKNGTVTFLEIVACCLGGFSCRRNDQSSGDNFRAGGGLQGAAWTECIPALHQSHAMA